jgi:spore maturation protein CgeB
VKVVIFGLTVGTSLENPHAAMWPALIRELHTLGHRVVFFERAAGKSRRLEGADLFDYPEWKWVRAIAAEHLADADAAIVTSACADVAEATRAVLGSNVRVHCFYDLDPAATLGLQPSRAQQHFTPPGGMGGFDVVLSDTGGRALAGLKSQQRARHVVPFYGCVDPDACREVQPEERYRADVSYLGEWVDQLQAELEALFLEPARRRPDLRFTVGSPRQALWAAPANVTFLPTVPPGDHARFFSSSRLTLSIANPAAAEMGYCPSVQIFEAAGCGVPVLTDEWDGLDYFFEAGREILVARTTGHVMDALAFPAERLSEIGRAGRERVLSAHTAARRALDLENILEAAISLPVEQTEAGRE